MLASLKVMLGMTPPRKPGQREYSPGARSLHNVKRDIQGKKERVAAIKAERDLDRSNKWRNRRWATLIIINLLFVLSFQFDVQLVEGALTASRVLGFHFADLNAALQVMLAYKVILINLVIGTGTVLADHSSQFQMCTSVPQMADLRTFISTSLGPGSGTGTICSQRPCSGAALTSAFISLLMR